MASVQRSSDKEKEDAAELAEIEGARIDPEDMGCGQRCFFTYGQMCQRAGEMFNCCLTDYEEAMQKERRWEETVRLKERVLKQRDHLVRLEREQKALMDRMTIFQTDTTQLIEETGENVRKELKKAFKMEVDISTKELMRKHERLARLQNGMQEQIGEHEERLDGLDGRTEKIKRELNETFIQLQGVDQTLQDHQANTDHRFKDAHNKMDNEHLRVDKEFQEVRHVSHNLKEGLEHEKAINRDQNLDLVRVKKALEALRQEQIKMQQEPEPSGLPIGAPGLGPIGGEGGLAGKLKLFGRKEEDDQTDTDLDLPEVPDEEPKERPKFYEYMIQTPDEGETPSEFEVRMERNEAIGREKTAEEKMEKRRFKKRAKRKKIADAEKTLKKKSSAVAAAGGGAGLPTHVTNA